MKTNLHIKFVSIFNLVQLHLESIDLPKIYVDENFKKLDRIVVTIRLIGVGNLS
jgi:hypothetical protein